MSRGGWCFSVRRPSHRPSAGTTPSWLLLRLGRGRNPRGRHTASLLGNRGWWGMGQRSLLDQLFFSILIPTTLQHSPVLGTHGWPSDCLSVPWARTLPSLYSNTLAPRSRQVRFGRVHTLPLLRPRAARKAHPQRQSLSWSLLRYLTQVLSVLVIFFFFFWHVHVM